MAVIYKCDRCGREIDGVDIIRLSFVDCTNEIPPELNRNYDICSCCVNGFVNWLKYGGEFDLRGTVGKI